MRVEDSEFLAFLRETFKTDDVKLERLPRDCADCAYRLLVGADRPIFCKRVTVAPHVIEFLENLPPSPLVANLVGPKVLYFKGKRFIFLEWREVRSVALVDMTEGQFRRFAEGCRDVHTLLAHAKSARPARDGCALMTSVRAYCSRYPLARPFFRSVLKMAPDDYLYSKDAVLPVTHGDFHKRNFGFTADGQLVFMDFDLMIHALPAEDVTQFVENGIRHFRMIFDRARRTQLLSRYERLIRALPYPLAEWRLAFNRVRLLSAFNVIESKGDSFKAAYEFLRRDLPLRFMESVLDRLAGKGMK